MKTSHPLLLPMPCSTEHAEFLFNAEPKKKVGITNLVTMLVLINFLSKFTLHLSFIVFENKYLPQLITKNLLLHLEVAILGSHLVANLELHFIKQQMEDSCSNKSTNMKLILLRVLLTNISSTLPATTTEHSWPKLLVYTLSDIKL